MGQDESDEGTEAVQHFDRNRSGRNSCMGMGMLGWSGRRAAASLRPFLSKIAAIVPTSVDSQVIRFAKISNQVHRGSSKSLETTGSNGSFSRPHQDLRSVRSLLGDGFNLQSGMVSGLVAPLHMLLYARPERTSHSMCYLLLRRGRIRWRLRRHPSGERAWIFDSAFWWGCHLE